MDQSQQKEQFSIAFAHAVATVAGFKLYKSDVDDESVDVGIAESGGNGTARSPRIEAQLKCSEMELLKTDGVHFQLKRKNYDDLRDANLMVPKILVVLLVPTDLGDWLTEIAASQITLKRHAWWVSLAGEPERAGVDSPTVILPRAQQFNPNSLRSIMQKVARREPL